MIASPIRPLPTSQRPMSIARLHAGTHTYLLNYDPSQVSSERRYYYLVQHRPTGLPLMYTDPIRITALLSMAKGHGLHECDGLCTARVAESGLDRTDEEVEQ